VGLRGYVATRQFLQRGFDAINVSGGFKSFQQQIEPAAKL
jgi:hypothetical protein